MKSIALLISPRVKSAYFNDYIKVVMAELSWVLPERKIEPVKIGEMEFLKLQCLEEELPQLPRLSFVYGVFEYVNEILQPLDLSSDFFLHEDFVFGFKYKGKTNEILTQMLINVGLKSIQYSSLENVKLLDPMCGRATTLLWAMRYGIKAKGIEHDPKALADIKQNVKKISKIHRQKHDFKDGFVGGKASKKQEGKFIDFYAQSSSMRVISGDSKNTAKLLNTKEKFDLIVSDIPYGIHHFTTQNTRNPLEAIKESIDSWKSVLKKEGSIVISFNNYLPKRKELIELFESFNMKALDFNSAHRMSESIVRDIVIFKKA